MQVKIERMDHLGNGIGYIDGKIVFVPKTIPGDEVIIEITKEHKNYIQGKLIKIINPSSDRITAFCPYYDHCGGCHLQNLAYAKTLEYKKERVSNILKRCNINNDITVVANESPLNYRNKIELKIKDGNIGFYSAKSHDVIQIDNCLITKKCINDFIFELKKVNIQNGDALIRCNYNDELLVAIWTKDNIELNEKVYPKFKVVGIILNDKCIYGENHFMDKINNYFFEVSYDAFFQVNSFINSKLFELISEKTKGQNVLDLYSGVGTLSLMASLSAKQVFAIESVPNAVTNALKNAKINNVTNVNFILGKVEDKIYYVKDKIDTIIVDPPRQGLDNKTISKILKIKPEKIIYISCETQKLSEDLKQLQEAYNVEDVSVFDMFSYTYHVECVCILKRKETN